jgi:hypothetical protein
MAAARGREASQSDSREVVMMRSKASILLCMCVVAIGCAPAEDDGDDGGGGAGFGGAGIGGAGIGGAGIGGAGIGGVGGAGVGGAGVGGAGAGGGGAGGGGAGGSGGGGMGGGGAGGSAGSTAPLDPTFTNIVDTIFPGCAGPTCHSSTAGGGLLLQADKATVHAALMGDAMGMNLPPDPTKMNCVDTGLKRVVAGNPEMSLLYLKVQTAMDPPCGVRMPTGSMLDPPQVMLIRDWIMAGANND